MFDILSVPFVSNFRKWLRLIDVVPTPVADNATDLGTNTNRFKDCRLSGKIYLGAVQILTGTGSPENAVTAPVGSLFTRQNGGAGTVLYVKESGAGNTGWIAK
jgi:hypothetical protein